MNRRKEERKEKKLTQQDVADAMGISRRGFQKWENGDSQLKPEKAKQLADFFGVSVGYLLNYSNSKKDPFDDYIPTPREYRSWQEFDYMQLSKTDLDFHDYEKLRKHLEPFALELLLNYFFCTDDERELLRTIAKKFAKKDAVSFKKSE